MQSLRRIDIFPKFDAKFEQDAREKTVFGAAFSILAIILIVVLVIGEFRYFLSIEERHELFVDRVIGGDMEIEVNVSFPQVPCDLMTLDAVNAFGEYQGNLDRNAVKHRINSNDLQHISKARPMDNDGKVASIPTHEDGAPKSDCGSCYGAESHPGECCHTCADVEAAYNRRGWHFNLNDVSLTQCAKERLQHAASISSHEGCNLWAKFPVARVQGNIHFIPGRAFTILGQHMHDLTGGEVGKLNLSHYIHTLQFGTTYPGQANPLDDKATILADEPVNGRFNYYVKVVPTTFEKHSLFGATLETNQYSVTEHFSPRRTTPGAQGQPQNQEQQVIPGVFLIYDLSPIRVKIFEARPYSSLVHFMLQLCAIIGGVFTVMGIIDAIFYHSIIRVRRKMQMGKQS